MGPILLVDGVCDLCNRAVVFVVRRDRDRVFRFAALQSSAGRRLLDRHGLDPDALDTVVLIDGDRAYTRSRAALEVARRLPGPWHLLYVLRLVPRPIRDAAYDLIARSRYRIFGRADVCLLPNAELEGRLLS